MNKVILIGRLARDPEMRTTASGTNVTRFTIAVDRGKNQEGNDKGTDFISCIAWRSVAENTAKYCVKGSQIAIDGRIQTGSYDGQDGTKKYTTDVIADRVMFLSNNQPVNSNEENSDNIKNESEKDPFADFGEQIQISDDDLPF